MQYILLVLLIWGNVFDANAIFNTSQNSVTQWQISSSRFARLTIEGIYNVKYGRCTYKELSIATRGCESKFYKELITNPMQSCQPLFNNLEECTAQRRQSCFAAAGSQRLVHETIYVRISDNMNRYSQDSYCNQGTLSLPSNSHPINYCSVDYRNSLASCFRTFHRVFRNNAKNPEVCVEFAKAKQCMTRVQDKECEYGPDLQVMQEATRRLYRCWNPFCLWHQHRPTFEWLSPERRLVSRGIPADCAANTASMVDGLIGRGNSAKTPPPFRAGMVGKQRRAWSPEAAVVTTPAGGSDVIKSRIAWCTVIATLLWLI